MTGAAGYREVAEDAYRWVLGQVRTDELGPWLPQWVPDPPGDLEPHPDERDCVYYGVGGLVLALAELRETRSWTAAERDLADAVADRLAARTGPDPSLGFGAAGDLVALRLLRPGSEAGAAQRLLASATEDGWPYADQTWGMAVVDDLLLGNAGVLLTLVWCDAADAAPVLVRVAESVLASGDETPYGLDWAMYRGRPGSRMPNYSHGTAGIAAALAVVGTTLGRADLVAAAVRGAEHVVGVGDTSDGNLRVPRSVPHVNLDHDEFTWNWCHGPPGTVYGFAALSACGAREVAGRDPLDWQRACLRAETSSGIPERRHPGFWDNDGRCCGTAGAGDAFLDAAQAAAARGDTAWADDLLAFAARLGDTCVEHAVRDDAGTRWRFVEHRNSDPLLDPSPTWMQGASGIAAFLLRLDRVLTQGYDARVVDRPDQWWAVPAALRVSGARSPQP